MHTYGFTGTSKEKNNLNNLIHFEYYSRFEEDNKNNIEYIKASYKDFKIETEAMIRKNTRLLRQIDFYNLDYEKDSCVVNDVCWTPVTTNNNKEILVSILFDFNLIVLETEKRTYIHSFNQLTEEQRTIMELNTAH